MTVKTPEPIGQKKCSHEHKGSLYLVRFFILCHKKVPIQGNTKSVIKNMKFLHSYYLLCMTFKTRR